MMGRNINFKNLFKIVIFFPVIFYFGKRSFIAFDEGFYALQARWILEKGNWIVPLWWDEYVLDRTIGIQFLMAKSQELFGQNFFSIYLPSTISSIIMLFVTYKLHEELFDKKYAIISPLILSTTYLWFDYSHLATQDIIYSCLVTIGIFSLINTIFEVNKFYFFLFGIWIRLAFMMITFLVAVPLASLTPYFLKTKNNFLFNKYFWIGLLFGFTPYLYWTYLIDSYLERNIIFYLFEKFNILANKNSFTNPFYYYFWNMPLTFLPWSFFSIIGLFLNIFSNKNQKFILAYFPLTFILIISFFSTKTPYYPLQISAILSLNAYQGISYLFNSKNYRLTTVFITSKLIPLFAFSCAFVYYFFLRNSLNFNFKESLCLTLGLILFALSWSLINKRNNLKKVLINLIIGPYLLTFLLLQSGLFSDRSRELRLTMEYLSSLDILQKHEIKVDKSSIRDEESQSKIIRISLLTPHLGEGIDSFKNLKNPDYVWTTLSKKTQFEDENFQIIYDDDILSPWKLIKKVK